MALTCCVVLPWGLFVILISCGAVEGNLSLNHCGGDRRDNYAEVIAGKADNQFTCSGIDGLTVEWRVGGYSAGRCFPPKSSGNSCDDGDVILGNVLSSTRTSNAESKVIIKGQGNLDFLKNGTLVCQEFSNTEKQADSCNIDIITPAEGNCSAKYNTSHQPWTVKVNCDITKASSSRGRYQCLFYQKFKDEQRTKLADWTGMDFRSSTRDRRATCSTSSELNADKEGRYTYSVKLKPGRNIIDAAFKGSNEIKRPAKPQIECEPTGYVPENTNITCSCSTTDTGLPAGRLRWSEHRSGQHGPILGVGRPGEKSLVLSKRLQRADHDVKQFRCDVVWAKDVLGDNYTAKVGYPVSRTVLWINKMAQDVEVRENSTVTLTCEASEGRPTPTLTLNSPRGLLLEANTYRRDHKIDNVQCEDSGVYSCIAVNNMGPEKNATNTLVVTCKPRDTPQIIHPINFKDKPADVTFDLTANPAPTAVTFQFLGSSRTTDRPAKVKDIILRGRCSMKPMERYRSTCTITVQNVTSASASGFYLGTLTNKEGSTNFTFEVTVNATEPDGEPSSTSNKLQAIGGAIAGVIVLAAIIGVIVFIVKRKRGPNAVQNNARQGRDVSTVAQHQEENPDTQGVDSETEVLYSVVDKSAKKNKKTKETEGVYGNVDKTTKKKQKAKKNVPAEEEVQAPANQDELQYICLEFDKRPTDYPTPAPAAEESVTYTSVDFTKTAPQQ